MNHKNMYDDDDDDEEDDGLSEDLEELRLACILPNPNSASTGLIPSDNSENEDEDDFDTLQSIKTQLAPSTKTKTSMDLSSDSENEEDDFEMLQSIKNQLSSSTPMDLPDSESDDDFEMLRSIKAQLALPMDQDEEDDDSSFESLRKRFSDHQSFDGEGNFTNDSRSPGKIKQVLVSDNEPSSEILSRSNTCESFPDSEQVLGAGHLHESSLVSTTSSSFPEAARALVDAIRKNRAYQKLVREKLTEIEATIEQNKKLVKNVRIVKDFQGSCKRKTKLAFSQRKDPRVELITTRKSLPSDSSQDNDKVTSPLTFGPLANSCVANYRIALERYPVSVHRRIWTAKENESLAKGVKQQFQAKLIREASEQFSDIDTALESIKSLEITPEMISKFGPEVDWDQLDLKNRSAAECEARWISSEDPLINHDQWTAEEDKNLCLIIQEKGFMDWRAIAESLQTNRTPFQCLARYQRSLNPAILGREWTPEEDDQLRAAVDWFGEKDWQSVANLLHGRTGKQCSERWMKSLHPSRTTEGEWSLEEEKRLKVAVTFLGTKEWNKIAQFVPGRTDVQCREKWKYSFDPNVKRGGWSEEEDEKLNKATEEHGYGNWTKVALHVPGRDRKQCRRRWNYLNPSLLPLMQEAKRLRREATVGNFVDRESERPALPAYDFMALAEISLAAEQPEIIAPKKKRKAREKKSDGAATERQPKKRRKGSGDVFRQDNETVRDNEEDVMCLEWHSENQDNAKEKKQRRKRKNVTETSSNSSVITTNFPQEMSSNSSVITTSFPQVKSGIQKLKPRRKASAVVPNMNQDTPVLDSF